MRLGRIGYYSDFVVYPAAIAVATVAGLYHAGTVGGSDVGRWIAIFVLCLVLWTFVEYLMHRLAFHHLPGIKELHLEHHVHEQEPIGTPTYVSLSLHVVLVFLPVYWWFGFTPATAACAGLMLGYLWYISVHHGLHHWHPAHSTYFYALKRRHAVHHHVDENANFGVTSGLWDRVFGTYKP